jgi:F0F1-type ATP synthase assembly protein I
MTDPKPRAPNTNPGRPTDLSASNYAGLGLQFAVGIILSLYLGQWIDTRLGTSPAFLIGCIFAGAAGSFYSIYRKLSAAQKKDDELHGRTQR